MNDIASVKTGESCYIAPAEPIGAAQSNDVSKTSLSEKEKIVEEKKTASQPVLETQTVPSEESHIKNENAAAPLSQQKAVEAPLDKVGETGRGKMAEHNKPHDGIDTHQPNMIYEAVESLSPVRNTVDPLDLPQKIENQ